MMNALRPQVPCADLPGEPDFRDLCLVRAQGQERCGCCGMPTADPQLCSTHASPVWWMLRGLAAETLRFFKEFNP
jgi:hypothetical protein